MVEAVGYKQGAGQRSRTFPGRLDARIRSMLVGLGASVVAILATTVLGYGLREVLPAQAVLLLYLGAVVVAALIGGRAPALVAAVLGVLAYDYWFTAPLWTLTIADPAEGVALAVFSAVALVTGGLASRRTEESAAVEERAALLEGVLTFSTKLAAAVGVKATMDLTTSMIAQMLDARVVLLVERDGELMIESASPTGQSLAADDLEAARTAYSARMHTGRGTKALPQATFSFRPIVASQLILAVAGFAHNNSQQPQGATLTLLDAMLGQAAIAIDRALKARDSQEAVLLRESERLQTALLNSLSHDFRTPLASITGAASSLRTLGDRLSPETREDLLASIEEDSDRLKTFLGNFLNMSRIESGRLRALREPLNVNEIVDQARRRITASHPDFALEASLASDVPPAEGDPVLLAQILDNLLDNARKYGGSQQPVQVYVRNEDDAVTIAVVDHGKGIPAAELDRVFDKFYRLGRQDGRPAGTGLGLSIARGFATAMGATIVAESPAARRKGTRFTVRLPKARTM